MTLLAPARERARAVGPGALLGAASAAALLPVALLLLVAAVAGRTGLLAAALVLAYVLDALLYAGPGRAGSWLSRLGLDSRVRAAARESYAVLGWVVVVGPPGWLLALVLVGLGVLHAVHATYRSVAARARVLRHTRFRWANLTVAGLRAGPPRLPPAVPALPGFSGARTVLALDAVLVGGLLVGAWRGATWPVLVALAALTAGCAFVLVRVAARRRLLASAGTGTEVNAPLRSAVRLLAPKVGVYFSGPPGTTYQLDVWLETLQRVAATPAGPPLLILREEHHLAAMLPNDLPTVVLPRARDVEEFLLPTLRVVLYPAAVIQNNHMLRLASARHVFVNHGDGDKAVTYSPVHRVFDEIWVAGQAARDRYLTKGEGVRSDQLVDVGRPQLAHIRPPRRRPAGALPAVLYAPTWEGNFDDSDYSSVARMGPAIVEALLALDPPVRVLVKPHPASGTRSAATRAALALIGKRLRSAGEPHGLVAPGPDALYDAFNLADLMIADVSSVVADFLASAKPYVLTNPQALPHERYADLPSAAGGAVLDPGDVAGELPQIVADALGPDPLAAGRQQLAAYFLGTDRTDPVGRFVAEVGRVLERAETARPAQVEVSR